MVETYAEAKATVRRVAEQAFADHVLREEGPGEWTCSKPGTGSYSFRVIVRAGTVMVWGDIGCGIFRGGEAGDTLSWLREAADGEHPEYLLGKLYDQQEEWYADDALAYAQEALEEGGAVWKRVLEEAKQLERWGQLDGAAWSRLVYDETNDPEYCRVGWSFRSADLWLIEALRWLVTHLPAEKAEPVAAEAA